MFVRNHDPDDYIVDYDSLDDLVQHVDSLDYRAGASRSHGGGGSWAAGADWDETVRLARSGWNDGLRRISDLRDELYDVVGQALPEPRPFMDVAGFDVDVGAWVAGEPEHMVTWADQEGQRRHIHIVLNLAASAHVTAEALMLRGSIAAALVDAFEHMGHRVTLDVNTYVKGYGDDNRLLIRVAVKRESEVLDLERLAFAAAHPAMFRRLVFAAMERLPDHVRPKYGVPGGYGQPGDARDDEQGDVYIAAQFPRSNAEALDEVLAHLREAGILPEEEVAR